MSRSVDEYIKLIYACVQSNDEAAFYKVLDSLNNEFNGDKTKRLSVKNFERELNNRGTIKMMNEAAEYSLLGYAAWCCSEGIFNGLKALNVNPVAPAKTTYRNGRVEETYTLEEIIQRREEIAKYKIDEARRVIAAENKVLSDANVDLPRRRQALENVEKYSKQEEKYTESFRSADNIKFSAQSAYMTMEVFTKEMEKVSEKLEKADSPKKARGEAKERLEELLKHAPLDIVSDLNGLQHVIKTPAGEMTYPQFFIHYGFKDLVKGMEEDTRVYLTPFKGKYCRGVSMKVNETAMADVSKAVRVQDASAIEYARAKVVDGNKAIDTIERDIVKKK